MKKSLFKIKYYWLTFFLSCTTISHAADLTIKKNAAVMMKYAVMKPAVISGTGGDPTGAINFNNETFREYSIASPPLKGFTLDISAVLTEEDDIERINAQLRWGGILSVINQGKVSGTFKEDDNGDFSFPNSQNFLSNIGQTILPEDREFSGDYLFVGLGVPDKYSESLWRGIYYKEYQAPVEHWITGINENDFARYDNEPFAIIDAKYKTRSIGYFQRWSTAADSLRAGHIPSQSIVFGSSTSAFVILTGDIMLGYAEHEVGENVVQDFANATDGLELIIEKKYDKAIAMQIAQEWGWLAIKKTSFGSFAMSAGVAFEFNMYFDDILMDNDPMDSEFRSSKGQVHAGYNRDVMDILYGWFLRVGVLL